MKTITRILTLTLVCCIAPASAWAQNADAAYKEFRKYRDDKTAASDALMENISKAGVDFLTAYPTDKNAPRVVNDMLSYGTSTLAKDKAGQSGWYMKVQFKMLEKIGLPDDAKGAMAALAAAIAEGELLANPSGDALREWRGKIDALAQAPNGTRFLLDREKGFFNCVTNTLKGTAKLGETQLALLVDHKDKAIADWAKQQTKLNEVRKTPFAISFTDINGKAFDSAKLKGPPALYVYFWSISSKGAADDMNKLADQYIDFGRKQIEFVAICTDPDAKRDEVLAFLKKNKLRMPVYHDEKAVKELRAKLGNPGVPSGILFDNKGMMVGQPGFKYGDLKKYIK